MLWHYLDTILELLWACPYIIGLCWALWLYLSLSFVPGHLNLRLRPSVIQEHSPMVNYQISWTPFACHLSCSFQRWPFSTSGLDISPKIVPKWESCFLLFLWNCGQDLYGLLSYIFRDSQLKLLSCSLPRWDSTNVHLKLESLIADSKFMLSNNWL